MYSQRSHQKAVIYTEPTDVNYFELYRNKPTWPDIIDAFKHCDTLHAQSQLLGILWEREGPYFSFPDGFMVKDKLERLSRQAGTLRHWSVVRYCSSILKKIVESISPYITSVLVNGKQMTIGQPDSSESVIDHPLTPKEIHSLFYSSIKDPYEVVLQQEITLYVGRLVSTTPQLFNGILKIRIGFVIDAMKFYLKFKGETDTRLEALSPSQIRKVLFKVLTDQELSTLEKRKIDGAMGRVPRDFYDKVWDILTRLKGGLRIRGAHLESQYALTQMTKYELNFALFVETYLGKVNSPQYRHIVVEMLVILYMILERNPEITFPENEPFDIDEAIQQTVEKYREKSGNELEKFYSEDKTVTSAYLARVILDNLLKNSNTSECKIS